MVFASGNSSPAIDYPANFDPDILCVGAIDINGSRANFSGYGSDLDVVAPGVDILSTVPNQGTASLNGTSMAAPHVSGLAALILSKNPDLDVEEVNNIIEKTTKKIGGYGYSTTSGRPNGKWDDEAGYGLINAYSALQSTSFKINGPSQFCPSASYSINPKPSSNSTISWSVSPSNAGGFSSTNSISTTFTRNSGFSGSATITATINGDNTHTVNKSVNIYGTISMSWTGTGPYGQVDVYVSGGSSPYKFYRNGSLIYTSYSNPTTVPFGCDGGVLKVQANTPCGIAYDSDIIPSGCYSMYSIYPNPSSTEINISIQPDLSEYPNSTESVRSEQENPLDDVELLLMDFTGNILYRMRNKDKNLESIHIDVSNFKKGIYFLKIIGKETSETHKVIIE